MVKKVEIKKPDDFLKLVEKKQKEYLYHDHPNDGIDLFCDDELEELGWHSSVFDFIKYRNIANFIEKECEGTLYFNDHPMGFNGFLIIENIQDVRKKVKNFIIEQINLHKLDEYDEEQKEALEYFGIDI
jgi:hypothetical protein